ncbi:MAG TPA: hypothetical protein VFV87_19140 [Pirellulaceae bacterium]|nr:hypothetical protein [Pirellulaceae bacterium]
MSERLHLFICVADHYEPQWNSPPASVAAERVQRWIDGYPRMAEGLEDSTGRPPQHTFFYPEEEYEPGYLEALAGLCRAGYGDVEVHLHHDHDTADGLREKLDRFTSVLHHEHGLLERNDAGQITYGFIHGNWALDNSRPDGRWCGVNNELSVLMETGCYADFTMPSAPAECQTSTINSIYYAADDPERPKSHDQGSRARVGSAPRDKTLLMIQGPLALDWSSRKWGLLPRIENGDLTLPRPPTLERLQLWRRAHVHVTGRPDWLFVKLHTHGAQERNAQMLLGEPMRRFHQQLRRFAGENEWFRYYYVTAREMASLVHQAESGATRPCIARTANPVANPIYPSDRDGGESASVSSGAGLELRTESSQSK